LLGQFLFGGQPILLIHSVLRSAVEIKLISPVLNLFPSGLCLLFHHLSLLPAVADLRSFYRLPTRNNKVKRGDTSVTLQDMRRCVQPDNLGVTFQAARLTYFRGSCSNSRLHSAEQK